MGPKLAPIMLLILSIEVIKSRPAFFMPENDENPKLIFMSFDGFRWDYLENHTLPNLRRYFVDQGVKVEGGLLNAFTTVTWPNHYTLATGLFPESHGKQSTYFNDKLNTSS
jgi:ectonucleotide pyrophosphatase/phosphodiesterase family protein 4